MSFDTATEFALCAKTFPPNRAIGLAPVTVSFSYGYIFSYQFITCKNPKKESKISVNWQFLCKNFKVLNVLTDCTLDSCQPNNFPKVYKILLISMVVS